MQTTERKKERFQRVYRCFENDRAGNDDPFLHSLMTFYSFLHIKKEVSELTKKNTHSKLS